MTKKAPQLELHYLKLSLKNENPFSIANLISQLKYAEDVKAIDQNWRKEIDLNQALKIIKTKNDLLVGHWLENYDNINQIIGAGYGLEYEEWVQVLSLRSGLTNVYSYIPSVDKEFIVGKHNISFEKLDQSLETLILQNKPSWLDCLSNIKKRIPVPQEQWWWHINS